MQIRIIKKENIIIICSVLLTIFSVFPEVNIGEFYKEPIDGLQTFFFYWSYLIVPYFISGLLFYGITKRINKSITWVYIFFNIIIIIIFSARWATNDWFKWFFYWPACAVVVVFVSLFLLFNRKKG